MTKKKKIVQRKISLHGRLKFLVEWSSLRWHLYRVLKEGNEMSPAAVWGEVLEVGSALENGLKEEHVGGV